jgi:hypothetical protein
MVVKLGYGKNQKNSHLLVKGLLASFSFCCVVFRSQGEFMSITKGVVVNSVAALVSTGSLVLAGLLPNKLDFLNSLAWLVSFVAVRFIAYAFYLPAKWYFEEYRLYSWDEVKVSVDRDPIFGVGLRIKSDKDIKEIGREVRSFWKGQSKLLETPVELLTLKEEKQMLTRVKKGVYKGSRMIPVANCDDGKAWLVTSENRDECLVSLDKGKFYIEIALTGMINERKLEDFVFAGDLSFDGTEISLKGKRKKM